METTKTNTERRGEVARKLIFGANPKRTLVRIGLWGVATIVVFHYLVLPIKIVGTSMTPTYPDGSMNFINKLSYARHVPNRGDVIALQYEGEVLLKRIIGMPGEQISIEQGVIELNGKPVQDVFAYMTVPWELEAVRLGRNEYFVIGDNRNMSVFAKIGKSQILGKIIF